MYLAISHLRNVTLMLGLLAVMACSAQHGGTSDTSTAVNETAITPETLARLRLENPKKIVPLPQLQQKPYAYRLGAGDQLLINLSMIAAQTATSRGGIVDLSSRSGLTDRQLGISIGEDGVVNIPILGPMQVLDKTLPELRKELYAEAKRYFKYPLIEIKVLDYRSKQVSVTGAVETPTTIMMDAAPLFITQLVEQAGGYLPEADLRAAEVIHASGEKTSIDLVELLVEGDQRYNYRLKAGDVLHLPVSHQNRVFVFGEVIRPRAHTMPPISYTLADALADSLGPNPITSSGTAYVVRGAVDESQAKAISVRGKDALAETTINTDIEVYTLDLEAREAYALADQFFMQPRDVVYITPGAITKWGRFINQLLPLGLSTAVTAGTNVQNAN